MTYKILFLDIDGTILKPDHTVPDSTKDAIFQVKQRGIQVFLATGRPLHEVKDLAEELGIHSYIGYNGAYAVHEGHTIIDKPMDGKIIRRFIDIAKTNSHEMVLYTSEKNYFTSLGRPIIEKFIQTFQLKQNERFHPSVENRILGVTLIDLNGQKPGLYDIDADLHFSPVNVIGVEQSLDVIRKSINKGIAVKKMLQHLDIPNNAAIAFGDGMNDKEMLEEVGKGFAMGNSHPDLFACAKHRTSDVSDSGIFNGLQQLGLVE